MFWLSFCDGTRPTGQQFLGGCVVRADSMISAVVRAHSLGINPGGEVRGVPVSREVPDQWVERLLSRDECAQMDREIGPA